MPMEALFGKLLAYEYKLIQQSHVKDTKKKKKWIVLKASSLKENHKEESSDDEDAQKLNLMVKKFGKFLNGSKENKFSKPSKKDGKPKKAYIAWEDNLSTSSKSSSEEEIANACLMVDSMDDSSTIEEFELNSEFEEVLKTFNEMHEEAQKLAISNNKLRSDLK
ncbi:hypothetical protein GmHk_18G052111 [Glycine max]|nr:hypothetical protein GmHk_18G052111 [Glycine max]